MKLLKKIWTVAILGCVFPFAAIAQNGSFQNIQVLLANPPQQVSNIGAQRLDNPAACSYYYWVVANFIVGNATPAGPAAIPLAACTLTNGNQVSWALNGAVSYDVLVTSTPNPPTGACNCAVATGNTSGTVTDTGTRNAYTVNTFNPATLAFTLANVNGEGPGTSLFEWIVNGSVIASLDSNGKLLTPNTGGIVYLGGTFPCSGAGISSAIASSYCANGACKINTSACSGKPQITSTVSIPQGVDIEIFPGACWQTSACPAFKEIGEGAVLEGTSMGNSLATYSCPGQSTSIIQAVNGCSGPIFDFDIQAGTKGGDLRNIRLDCNSVSGCSGITNGLNGAQVEQNRVMNVSVGNVASGGVALTVTSNSQNFWVRGLDAEGVAQGINAAASIIRNLIIEKSRIVCVGQAVPCVILGTDDNLLANASQNILLDSDDIEAGASGSCPTAPTSLVKVQNVRNYVRWNGWTEPNTCLITTMEVFGDASSTPDAPAVFGTNYQGDANSSYAIEFNHALFPFVYGASGYAINNNLVKNTAGNTSGTVMARPAAGGISATSPVDSAAGLTGVSGSPSDAAFLAPSGLWTKYIQAAQTGVFDYDAFDTSSPIRFCRNHCSDIQFFVGSGANTILARLVNNMFTMNESAGAPTGLAGVEGLYADPNDHMWHQNNNNGGNQQIPIVVTIASQYTNSTTGFTTVLSFPVDANKNYTADCHLYYQAAATGGLNIQFTGPASPTSVIYGLNLPVSATANAGDAVATAFGTSLGSAVTTAATNFDASVTFELNNGANAGTVTLQAKSSAAVQLQIQAGSWCQIQ